MARQPEDHATRHTIPVIDRMMDVLEQLEHPGGGLSIRQITQVLSLPRTTVYRILNTLQVHDVVRRDESGGYHLGPRLLALASRVPTGVSDFDLSALAQPHMDRLAAELGESVKLSIVQQDGVVVLAAVHGRREYALTVKPGQRLPIHAGAASKVLLSHLPPEEIDGWLSGQLEACTQKTITDPQRLRAELARIRRQGWARDKGEQMPGIHAFAAPIVTGTGRVIAAVSIPFLVGAKPNHPETIREAVVALARRISEDLPAGL